MTVAVSSNIIRWMKHERKSTNRTTITHSTAIKMNVAYYSTVLLAISPFPDIELRVFHIFIPARRCRDGYLKVKGRNESFRGDDNSRFAWSFGWGCWIVRLLWRVRLGSDNYCFLFGLFLKPGHSFPVVFV